MSQVLWLSRARLRRDAPIQALVKLLVPDGPAGRAGAGHRLVWTLFGDTADRDRDFLWREAEPGLFYTLSHRPPEDRHGIFDLDEPKSFAPSLKCGDRLTFSLRANATIAKGGGPDRRGKPCDVVMDAIYSTPAGERASRRVEAIETSGLGWLDRQAIKAGFSLGSTPASRRSARVTAYQTLRIEHSGSEMKIGVLDFEGVLEVTDPDRLVSAVAQGFGRAKGFGCGLMLIRRA